MPDQSVSNSEGSEIDSKTGTGGKRPGPRCAGGEMGTRIRIGIQVEANVINKSITSWRLVRLEPKSDRKWCCSALWGLGVGRGWRCGGGEGKIRPATERWVL